MRQCEKCQCGCDSESYTKKGLRGRYCSDDCLEHAWKNPKFWKNNRLLKEFQKAQDRIMEADYLLGVATFAYETTERRYIKWLDCRSCE